MMVGDSGARFDAETESGVRMWAIETAVRMASPDAVITVIEVVAKARAIIDFVNKSEANNA